jgi:predicted transcriptional regulator
MKRTTIFVDEALEHDLKAIAGRRQQPVATVVREALAEFVGNDKRANPTSLSFVAAGASGRVDTADRHEEILWQDAAGGRRAARALSPPGPAPRHRGARADHRDRRSR